jgi:hypothetical protein
VCVLMGICLVWPCVEQSAKEVAHTSAMRECRDALDAAKQQLNEQATHKQQVSTCTHAAGYFTFSVLWLMHACIVFVCGFRDLEMFAYVCRCSRLRRALVWSKSHNKW